jgi:hypothetical protein
MKWISAFAMAGFMAVSSHAVAHGGGLNAEGCHHDRKTGDYHCHRGPAAPSQPPSGLRDASATGQGTAGTPAPSGSPACHVGPRGGTYTITSSGRRNYAGC